jgi:hypothetical protein
MLKDVVAYRILLLSRRSVRAMNTDPGAFDIGPTPPPWTLRGAQPSWDSLTERGSTVLSWTRDIGDLWIACEGTIESEEL